MATTPDTISMALFCDFENVAIGVREANYEKFDIKRVLERLLLKGSIVVKKAYCDWDRYKQFKGTMHEANFELIEIPHVRQSGKNSADIRLVVDALDLCYTKSHVNTFVIISGDSDFSPLVSKLRENAKQVIGVGVKQSTSDLLIANCDEFIFYDDLVRESERQERHARRGSAPEAQAAPRRSPADEQRRRDESEARTQRAIEITVQTLDALLAERGEGVKVRASVLKDAIKRRRPDFSENRYGFKSFGALLEEAQARGQLEIERDEKANVYLQRNGRAAPRGEPARVAPAPAAMPVPAPAPLDVAMVAEPATQPLPAPDTAPAAAPDLAPQSHGPEAAPAPAPAARKTRGGRGQGRRAAAPVEASRTDEADIAMVVQGEAPEPAAEATAGAEAPAKTPAKSARPRRPRQPRGAKAG